MSSDRAEDPAQEAYTVITANDNSPGDFNAAGISAGRPGGQPLVRGNNDGSCTQNTASGARHGAQSAEKPIGIRTGILGGTFDPIHLGHIHIACAAYDEYGLDEVWFMPAGDPYFKEDRGFTDAAVRLEMTRLCLKEIAHPGFKCSDFEIHDTTATYTSDTLWRLREEYPLNTFYFIMGYDSLKALSTWHRPDIILGCAVLLAAVRDGAGDREIEAEAGRYRKRYPYADIRPLHMPGMEISSTRVREGKARGEDISRLVTPGTLKYIEEHGLYSGL